jgi:hypothetical protein
MGIKLFFFLLTDRVAFCRVSGIHVLAGQVGRSNVCVSRVTLRVLEGERVVKKMGKTSAC